MTSPITIRPFATTDTPRLVAILETVFSEYGMRFDPSGYDQDVHAIDARYAGPDAVFYTAELEGRTVGFAGVDLPRPGVAELHRLYIDPAARGHALGKRLVAETETWARGRGATALELWSDVRFFHAHAMYAGLGYALMGQRQLTDPDRSVEFGFRRGLDRPATPVRHTLGNAVARPLASLDGTERAHWAAMVAAAILDSRGLVRAGRVHEGGHQLPSPGELFAAGTRPADVSVLSVPAVAGAAIAAFSCGGVVRAHSLFAG